MPRLRANTNAVIERMQHSAPASSDIFGWLIKTVLNPFERAGANQLWPLILKRSF